MVVERGLIARRKEAYLGKRVEFVSSWGDDPCPIQPGEQGLVQYVDDFGTLGVRWDSGRTLGVLVEDTVKVLG